jgi:hypothetical protein
MTSPPIPALKDKIIDLGLVPQDFFTANEFPIKPDNQNFKTWFNAHFFWGVTIPIIEVSRSKATLAWLSFKEYGSGWYVERCTPKDQLALGITDDMLKNAIMNFGGDMSVPGIYPIDARIRYKLAEVLES